MMKTKQEKDRASAGKQPFADIPWPPYNLLHDFRDDLCRVAELHTGVPQGKSTQGEYMKALYVLGWEKDVKELAQFVLDLCINETK